MFEPYGSYPQRLFENPGQAQAALFGLESVFSTILQAGQLSPEQTVVGTILGSCLVGQGYPAADASHWVSRLLNEGFDASGLSSGDLALDTSYPLSGGRRPALATVQGAEADESLRHLIETAINDEATAARLYANIAEAMMETGLSPAAQWVQGASRDEEKHLTLLQQRYQQLYHTSRQPQVGNTEVRELRSALTEALGDEFTDGVKYRDAYLRYANPRDKRIFFELMTDELRHATLFTYVIGLLK